MRTSERRRAEAFVLASVVLLAAACVTGGGSTSGRSRTSDVVDSEELSESTTPNAYDFVGQARPNWLRGRGSPDLRGGNPDLPIIYVAGVRYGPVTSLRGLATNTILEMRFIDAPTATTRYGNGHGGGVIEVTLRRR